MKKKVLVAEDEADLRRMMKIMLGIYGFEVIEARDGYEAVEKALEEVPDLIFMDLSMPILGGLESTRAIRDHSHLKQIPIVAITGYDKFYEERARAVGCTDVLPKPIDFAKLKPLIESYTGH